MEMSIGTIRRFQLKNFTIVVDAVPEHDLDLSYDEDGSVAEGLNSGQYTAFCARARVFFRGSEIGSDYLGGCVYEDLESFMDHRECGRANREFEAGGQVGRCGSYFADMIHAAIAEARQYLRNVQDVYVR